MSLDRTKYNPSTWDDLLEKYSRGDPVIGTVMEITDYGAWVELGAGITGLLHITDMSWRRVRKVRDLLTPGDRITCLIINVDSQLSRLSLGVKQLTPDPIEAIELLVGTTVDVIVTAIVDYGIYCEILPGVEGLIHVSELSWVNPNIDPHTVASYCDQLKVVVTEYDKPSRRISLSLRRTTVNPWEEFANKWEPGDVLHGCVVVSITDFGIFVELPGGIDGLVPIRTIGLKHSPQRGDTISILVEKVDLKRHRVLLRLAKN